MWRSRDRKISYVPRQPSPTLVIRRKRPYSAHISSANKRARVIDSAEVMVALQKLTITKRTREELPVSKELRSRGPLPGIPEQTASAPYNKRIRTSFNGRMVDLDVSEVLPSKALPEEMGIVPVYDEQAGKIPLYRVGGSDSSIFLRIALDCLGPHRCVSLAMPLFGTMWKAGVQPMLKAPGGVPTILTGLDYAEDVTASNIEIEELGSLVPNQNHSSSAVIDSMDWWE